MPVCATAGREESATHLVVVLDARLDLPRDEVDHEQAALHRRAQDEPPVLVHWVLCDRQGGRGERVRVEELERGGRVDLERTVDGGREDAGDVLAAGKSAWGVSSVSHRSSSSERRRGTHVRKRSSLESHSRLGTTALVTVSTLLVSLHAVRAGPTLAPSPSPSVYSSWSSCSRRVAAVSLTLRRARRDASHSSTTSCRSSPVSCACGSADGAVVRSR